jgi:hypothetical protein
MVDELMLKKSDYRIVLIFFELVARFFRVDVGDLMAHVRVNGALSKSIYSNN